LPAIAGDPVTLVRTIPDAALNPNVKTEPVHNSKIRLVHPITAKRMNIPTGAINKMVIFVSDVMEAEYPGTAAINDDVATPNMLSSNLFVKILIMTRKSGDRDIRYLYIKLAFTGPVRRRIDPSRLFWFWRGTGGFN
jgi:hypothetical protein